MTRSSRVPRHMLTVALLCSSTAHLSLTRRFRSFAREISCQARSAWVGVTWILYYIYVHRQRARVGVVKATLRSGRARLAEFRHMP